MAGFVCSFLSVRPDARSRRVERQLCCCTVEIVTQSVDAPDRSSDLARWSSRVAGQNARMGFDIQFRVGPAEISALNQSIEPTPSEGFKRYGTLTIAGNAAIVDDEGTVQWASTLPGYAAGYGPGVEEQTAMDFLEDIATSPSNRFCVECLHLLDGDERFCPNCGSELR